jgi:hypothetical protein
LPGVSLVSGTSAALVAIWRGDGEKLVANANGELFRSAADADVWVKVAALPTGSQATGMSAASSTDVVIVGVGVIDDFDGSTLSPVTPAPITGYPYTDVWGDRGGDIWAVGLQGGIVRRNAGSWSVARAPSGTEPALNAAWQRDPTDAWFVGDVKGAQPTVVHFAGTLPPLAQTLPTSIGSVSLLGVSGSATDLWATANEGSIVHTDGVNWDITPTGANAPLNAIGGTHDIFAVGKGGRILRLTP